MRVSQEVIGTDRPSYTMESSGLEEDDDGTSKGFDFFNTDHEIILEDEEEYDVLNNETFGGSIAGKYKRFFRHAKQAIDEVTLNM